MRNERVPESAITVRLAAYQGRSVPGDVDANLATVRRILQEAAGRGVDFLCLPETFLSGYGDRQTIERGALAVDDPRLVELTVQTGQHDIVLLVGLAERREKDNIANSVVILHRGQLLGVYRKTMLTSSDADVMRFSRDYDLPVFQAKGLTFGCIICADSSFFETAATMAYRGMTILFSPHFNCIPPQGMDDHRIRVRNNHIGLAALLDVYVVRSNVVVTDRERCLGYGDSAIFDPRGHPITEAGLFREALIFADATIPQDRVQGKNRLRDRVPEEVREQLSEAMRGYKSTGGTEPAVRC
jgi:predicted amidohydrolase